MSASHHAPPGLAALALFALAPSLAAQQPAAPTAPAKIVPAPAAAAQTQEALRQKRTEKLAKPVFTKAAWQLDYDAARKLATAQDKLLLVYFTRSYAH